jgi:uncharacterized protein HemX
MTLLIAKLLQWLASKLFAIILIWVLVIGGVALYLAGKAYWEELPKEKKQLVTQLESHKKELARLDERLAGLEGEFAKQAEAVKGRLDTATEELREEIRSVNKLRARYNRLNNWWRDSRHVLNRRLHLRRRLLQRVQIVAVNLDRDLSVDARDHMTNQVGKRLFDLDVHSGRFVADFLA